MLKKYLKKFIGLTCSATIIAGMSVTAFADGDTSYDFASIAEDIIQVTQNVDETGSVTTTFTNLDDFVDTVRATNDNISDYEIATFLLDYTQQEYENLPESEILLFLEYDNITTSCSYIGTDKEGNVYSLDPNVMSIDEELVDGIMRFVTSYSHYKTEGSNKFYVVTASATWEKYPTVLIGDAFVLGTNGTFDSNYNEYGSVTQSYQCTSIHGCSKNTHQKREVSKNDKVDGDLKMSYEEGVPVLHFTPLMPSCSYCGGTAKHIYFNTFVRYGIVEDECVNIQAGYGHKTFGLNNISVTVDSSGKPSFSGNVITVDDYIARSVTVMY